MVPVPESPAPMTELRRPRDLWRISIPAYGPTLFSATGTGAVMPVLTLNALDMDAPVWAAALIIAVLGAGSVLGSVPAGALVARIGERWALILGGFAQAAVMAFAMFASSLEYLIVAVLLMGVVDALFQLARQAYLTDAVPLRLRARALSTLGGVHRIGVLVGPFLGALVLSLTGDLRSAYVIGVVGGIAAAILLLFSRDITAGLGRAAGAGRPERVFAVAKAHRKVLATVGTGAMVVSAARAGRMAIIPLWADHIGLDAAQTSLIFGIAAAVDIVLFYPAGAIMDRYGRVWTAVPAVLILGGGTAALPLTSGFVSLMVVSMIMAVGNGLGSGIVMTLGSDASPPHARPQFLAAWRVLTAGGILGGPLAIAGVAATGGLALACVAMGSVTLAGAGWLATWVPRYEPDREDPLEP